MWAARSLLAACCLVIAAGAAQGQPEQSGFAVMTHADDASIAEGLVVIRYKGVIEAPMAQQLADIWTGLRGRYRTVVLHLDSPGGVLDQAEEVIATLKAIRNEATLKTLVHQGERCLSACVPVFMQGQERIAGGATSWAFHGACRAYSNVPVPQPTQRYVDLLREAGVAEEFLCHLADLGYLSRAGTYWTSGYELVNVHHANVITRLLNAWQPEAAVLPPPSPQILSR